MRYVGGKHRLAKHIIQAILKHVALDGWEVRPVWVEPFVGAATVIAEVPSYFTRIGADGDPYIIAMHKAVQAGWLPPDTVTNAEWRHIRYNKDQYPPELVAFVGYNCSYASRWFEGYARDPKTGHNYAASGRRNLAKMAPALEGVEFFHCDYKDLYIPPKSLVYCDPPYTRSVKNYYRNCPPFDHETFWNWCRDKAREGHKVYVSEFDAPADMRIIWSRERACSLDKDTGALRAVDRVFEVPA